eukprot:Colp12_sorted_trinity150504_noHs@32607
MNVTRVRRNRVATSSEYTLRDALSKVVANCIASESTRCPFFVFRLAIEEALLQHLAAKKYLQHSKNESLWERLAKSKTRSRAQSVPIVLVQPAQTPLPSEDGNLKKRPQSAPLRCKSVEPRIIDAWTEEDAKCDMDSSRIISSSTGGLLKYPKTLKEELDQLLLHQEELMKVLLEVMRQSSIDSPRRTKEGQSSSSKHKQQLFHLLIAAKCEEKAHRISQAANLLRTQLSQALLEKNTQVCMVLQQQINKQKQRLLNMFDKYLARFKLEKQHEAAVLFESIKSTYEWTLVSGVEGSWVL